MFNLNGLNSQQRVAAEIIEGPVLILAGAGTGKTRTITYRIAHMVENLNISPENILAVSFTNKASKEMLERTEHLLGKKKSSLLTLSTFHALGVRILRSEIQKLGYGRFFSIYDTSDQLSIIREALKKYKADKSFDRKMILSKISFLKTKCISNEEFTSSVYFNLEEPYDLATEFVYHYYQDKLKFYNAIDFDDILFLTHKLLRENQELREKYSQRFKYIMIDEYQDTNRLQFDLILHLTCTHQNLCVVGDDDQAIYAFRGADISNILDFEKHFPSAKMIKLEENYRSSPSILNLSNQVIKENKHRKIKTLWSKQSSTEKPYLWKMKDPEHEARIIIEDIAHSERTNHPLNEMAILYRSNLQAVPFEDQLRMNNIPYTVIGGQKFYEKKEIKDLMAYLMAILNPYDELALRRILNIPNRGIGNVTLKKYLTKALQNKSSLFKEMETDTHQVSDKSSPIASFVLLINQYKKIFHAKVLPEAIGDLIKEIDYLGFVEKQYDSAKQVEMRKKDVLSFIESAERFYYYHKEGATLRNFIEKILLKDSQDQKEESDESVKKNEVQLITLHSAKGLEFDTVYLAGVEEGLLPHKKTIQSDDDVSEERRLCYVGITRARQKLIMTHCQSRTLYGNNQIRHLSRFLSGLKDQELFIKQDRTTLDHLNHQEKEVFKKNFFEGLIDSLK
ncbi:MAG: hypothetical protein A2381_10530 [Bdellovibrionales bacterium RIFOXYB1_FULL_37_110]|nr:MAG: hypothetical protein A2417_05590 [Bdellovibrionales bacterium RIFOXYC1_FULL_37_79]OFZ61211.1 MAG: hypothetical protein A2381_10530 [Bdellovibrionales bacterium RIFOXYB1_FULL_37_110]OFZ65536.1 MAG: hypothetical protein A2577_01950 [Bdellovibrionales bacterium RIFOXYD1_FULL_36_51]